MATPTWQGVEYKGYAFTSQELAAVIPELGTDIMTQRSQYWADKLKNVRDYIAKALDAVFKDATAWRQVMDGRAVPRYQSFVNPSYPRASTILLKYRTKLLAAYDKWRQNKDAAFQPGGRFETGVDAAIEFYKKNVEIVYRMVGVRPVGLGPAVKAFLVAMGIEPPIVQGKDTLTGQVRNLLFSDTIAFTAYSIIPLVVEAVTYANYAHLAGDAALRDQILTDISNVTKEFLSRLAAADVQIDIFAVAYDENVENYYVHLKASPLATV